MLKKSASLIVAIILILSCLVVPVSAKKVDSESLKSKKAVVHGVEIEVSKDILTTDLNSITEKCAQYIAENDFGTSVAMKSSITIFDETTYQENNDQSSISSFSSIPSSQFYENVLCFRCAGSPDSGFDEFDFVYYAEILSPFVVQLTDCAGLAWSDDFAIEYTSCNAMYKYGSSYYNLGNDNLFVNRVELQNEAGVGYSLRLEELGYRLDHFSIRARVVDYDRTGVANICGQYAHKTFGLTMGVTVAPTPSVSFSGAVIYSESQGDIMALYY